MSNFDQAFIKAYARELTSDGELLTAPPRQVLATRAVGAPDLEFDPQGEYHRVDAPAVSLASPKLGTTVPSEPWGDVLPNSSQRDSNVKQRDDQSETKPQPPQQQEAFPTSSVASTSTQANEPIIFETIASVNSNAMELARQATALSAFFSQESTSIEISSSGVIAAPEHEDVIDEVVNKTVATETVATETIESEETVEETREVETASNETASETTADVVNENNTESKTEPNTETSVEDSEAVIEPTIAALASEEAKPASVPATPEPTHETLVPVWEVDNFDWPAVCLQLVDSDPKRWRDAVEGVLKRAGGNSLAVTGAGPALGRTTIAMCIARAYAIEGYRVLLVDIDRQSPEIASRLGLASPCCWGQAMEDNLPLEETTIHSLEDGLTVAPLIDAAAMCEFERMSEQINGYSEDFDLIVYDAGEVSTCLEQLTCLKEKVKAALVIADERLGQASDQEKIAEQLQTAGVIATGVIKNYTSEA